jgi:hypothetical protein
VQCEECGTALLIAERSLPGDGALPEGESSSVERVDWCPNLECPSNNVVSGVRQIAPFSFKCAHCDQVLGSLGEARRHVGGHL